MAMEYRYYHQYIVFADGRIYKTWTGDGTKDIPVEEFREVIKGPPLTIGHRGVCTLVVPDREYGLQKLVADLIYELFVDKNRPKKIHAVFIDPAARHPYHYRNLTLGSISDKKKVSVEQCERWAGEKLWPLSFNVDVYLGSEDGDVWSRLSGKRLEIQTLKGKYPCYVLKSVRMDGSLQRHARVSRETVIREVAMRKSGKL